MPANRVKRLFRRIENLRGRKKQKITGSDDEGDKSSSSIWTPKSLGDYPSTNIYNSASRSPPAELFRKDLISAMKLPDNEPLAADDYWLISDHWKQEWERGVQVPVNPEALPGSTVRAIRKKDRSADFKLPKKLIRLTHDEFFSSEIHQVSNCATLAEKMCRYDLDDTDLSWLKVANEQRKLRELPPIEEDALEKIVEELETQCSSGMQEAINSEAELGIEYDEDVICDVCRSPDSEDGNEMVFCDSCDICVHQACYGITSIPEGSWLCRTCSLSIKKQSCVLCPNKGGAMKCTRTGQKWAHVSCALWIPEVSIGCVEKMEPITKIGLIPPSRWALVCCICRDRSGACIQCTVKSCKTAYHVTCGFKSGLEMQAIFEDESDDEGVKLKSYCPKHSKDKESSVSSDSEDEDDKDGGSSSSKKEKISSEEKANARAKRLRQIEASFFKYVKVEQVAKAVHSTISVVQFVYHYWKLKRRAGFNAPLLSPSASEHELLSQGQEDDLYARMKMFVHLRQDLERVRNLCYMVSRREKLSRSWTRMREQIFDKQVIALTDASSQNLTDSEKRSVVHACHTGNIYDRLYASDMNCCASSSSSSTLAALLLGVKTESTENGSSVEKRSVERLPNPYARLYGSINGVLSRTRRKSASLLERNDHVRRCNRDGNNDVFAKETNMTTKVEDEPERRSVKAEDKQQLDERLKCDNKSISRQSPQHLTRSTSHRVDANHEDEGCNDVVGTNNNSPTSRSGRSRQVGDEQATKNCSSSDSKYLSAKENMERLALNDLTVDVRPPNNSSTSADWTTTTTSSKNDEDDPHNRRHNHNRHKKSKQRFRNLRSPSSREKAEQANEKATAATKNVVPHSPTTPDAQQPSPFKDKLRQETAKIRESLFSTSSLKGSLVGYRIPKKARNDSESDAKPADDANDLAAVSNTTSASTTTTTTTVVTGNNEPEQVQTTTNLAAMVSEVKPHHQAIFKNHWRETPAPNNVGLGLNPLQMQTTTTTTQRWNCNTLSSQRPAPLLPTPPMMMPRLSFPSPPLPPQYVADRRLTRRERTAAAVRTTIYESPPSSSSAVGVVEGGRGDECAAGRLVIKLRKDPNFPESHRWRRDGDVCSNNSGGVYDYDVDDSSPPSATSRNTNSSSGAHVRLKVNSTAAAAAQFGGGRHNVNRPLDPRLRRSISPSSNNNNCNRPDPRAFNKNRTSGSGGQNNNNNTYSMRSRTSLVQHNNFS